MSRRALVIGAGLAGLSAAIELAEQGIPVTLAAPSSSERAQSVMAQGGMNAVLIPELDGDTPQLHAQETYEAGHCLANFDAILDMTKAAGGIVEELLNYGASLSCNEQGEPLMRAFGGQTKKRTIFAGAYTGKHLCSALIMRARKFEAANLIHRRVGLRFMQLEVENGHASGAWFFNERTEDAEFIPADGIIVATGGLNGLFGNASGSVENQGTTTASLLASGLPLANLEMVQYHPTTIPMDGKSLLISEAARSEGARLFIIENGKRRYFMEEKYPQLGSLMPRDVVSREVHALIQQGHQVFLATDELDSSTFDRRLTGLRTSCLNFLHIDMVEEPLQIEPGVHFFMGGILIDREHRTNVRGLYAAGECACQYHGANRLGANSLLGAIYGGKAAARTLANDTPPAHPAHVMPTEPNWLQNRIPGLHLPSEMARLQALMRTALGVIRDEASLDTAITKLEELTCETEGLYDNQATLEENVAWPAQLHLAQAMLTSAKERRESRGAHYRIDYPNEVPEFQKTTIAIYANGHVNIDFKPIEGTHDESSH